MEKKVINETKYYELDALQVARSQVHNDNQKSIKQYLESQALIMKDVNEIVWNKVQNSVDSGSKR
jgi:hypothetical protein